MGQKALIEPARLTGSKQYTKAAALVLGIHLAFAICSSGAQASFAGTDLAKNIANIFSHTTGFHSINSQIDFNSLLDKADAAVNGKTPAFRGLFDDGAVKFDAQRATADSYSTTIKFVQKYNGLEVVGNEAIVHFDRAGEIHDVSGEALKTTLSVEPTVSLDEAHRILDARYGQHVTLSDPSELKVLKDFGGKTHLVYYMLTRSTATHEGQEVFLDAHDGQVVLEFGRALDAAKGSRTVYSADTDRAHEHVDARGYPTDINATWYDKVIEDGERADQVDRSALNAYRSAGIVYSYYLDNFNRKSYDDRDSRLVNVVHMGLKMNNAFWTNEYKLMAYGDGDGERLTDLTYGLDVAAHELTHGVTASTAKLVYAAESGALNESYSDFFGKMVDYGDWDIGARIMAPKWGRRALRNMENPSEFKQPNEKGGKYWVSTTPPCSGANDRCGVHTNSGVPNRAAVLITKALGKEKTERLYYKVLTSRLSATSDFADARKQTEQECSQMFGGDSDECKAVSAAFDAVKM
ncbi:MAG: peptidase M4 family protein [Deltaproteobacteria bacterium]|nr:peptidase M4 family protein [Deltaproteobacteria bacterium]